MGFLRISTTFLMFVILCFAESALADVQDALANLIDENLKTCVAEQIDINLQASEITKIECDERDIADLSRLSAFVGLTSLSLNSNKIRDLSPLISLVNIEFLNLARNLINDISSISDLRNLDVLVLRSNLIVNISPLSELKNITYLSLSDNLIEDVSPLSNLTTLTQLSLWQNLIVDISSFGNLGQLQSIGIFGNSIEDIGVLASLDNLLFVSLDVRSDSQFNILSSMSGLKDIYLVATDYRLPSYEVFNMDGLLSLECVCVIEDLVDFLSVLPLSLEYLSFGLADDVSDLSPLLDLPDAERFWYLAVNAPGVTNIDFLLESGFRYLFLQDSAVECNELYRIREASKANGGVSLSATGCYGDRTFDIDGSSSSQPLADGLLVIRYLFGFSGSSLTSGAVAKNGAERVTDERISEYLGLISRELDIDGDGESKPLTDGLLLIRYLFGFSGESLISGAIGDGAERDTADEVEVYIQERVPAQ